jgi:GST-like protein
MIDVHYWTTPNGHKITIFLEEAGLQYKLIPVNIGKGEQFKAEFLAVSPNNRIPAIVDHDPPGGGKPIAVFESGAILFYLAVLADGQSRPDGRAEQSLQQLRGGEIAICDGSLSQ